MNAFETTAIFDDASHLTLREPLPHLPLRECRVIVLYEEISSVAAAWPPGFFEEILITDPAFVRPPQGEMPSIAALDKA